MSYQVLARKWRPKTFREMVGQEHVLKALINSLDRDRLHHAYLFTGTRGVGKTTIARILARCLNCEVGVSSEPCGQCGACLEITENRFIDLIEVDAASRTKVEDTRELLENVQYAPTRGRYKVYLIDEVHMLSTHSFNALLKTLEEPPPHVKFLLATTDPQKLPATILSRCMQFSLKNMAPESIVGHLKYVLEQEMVAAEDAALYQLANAADGSMRDALSLTDQAIAFGSGKVSDSDVTTMLGSVDRNVVADLLSKVIAKDGKAALAKVGQLGEHGADYMAVLEELLSLLHRLTIAQVVPDAVEEHWGDKDALVAMAKAVPAEEIQLFYQMALNGRKDLAYAPDLRSGFEMILMRMLAFAPLAIPEWAERGATVASAPAEAQPASTNHEKVLTPAAQPPSKPEAEPPPWANEPAGDSSVKKPLSREDEKSVSAISLDEKNLVKPQFLAVPVAATRDQPVISSAVITASTVELAEAAKAETALAQDSDTIVEEEQAPVIDLLLEKAAEQWHSVFAQIPLRGVVRSVVANCSLEKVVGNTAHFTLDEAHASLFNDSYCVRIATAMSELFGQVVQAEVLIGKPSRETPATYADRLRRERQHNAVQSLQVDENVQKIIGEFSGTLIIESIKPLDS
ncbi:MAG: DNA polymerase-3 subunit gamma/tau [Pseudomonadales bacterium]|jgi:DNA polymerase-3 subunit gamma/tau